jgi:hypothetical protein
VSDVFAITGSYSATPSSGSSSADPVITASVDERLMLGTELLSQITLTTDTPAALPFGGLTSAAALIIKCVGGPITVSLTSSQGAAQVVPVDSFFALISATNPFTAISVARAPGGAPTVVRYFLGQRA